MVSENGVEADEQQQATPIALPLLAGIQMCTNH